MPTPSRIPADVAGALANWLAAHDEHAPGVIEGLYVVGSVALGDVRPGSDIDIVAVTGDPADEATAGALERAAADVQCERTIDGPYLAWGDLARPPLAALRPWTLDGRFHYDGDCFEINPVTWYTLATYGLVVRGEAPAQLGVPLDVQDRVAWVRDNVEHYWAAVVADLETAVEQSRADEFDSINLEWPVLGLARMLFTIRTGDVASKTAAGSAAMQTFPEHRHVFEQAVAVRAAPGVVSRTALVAGVEALRAMLAVVA